MQIYRPGSVISSDHNSDKTIHNKKKLAGTVYVQLKQ